MNISEYIEILKKLPPGMPIVKREQYSDGESYFAEFDETDFDIQEVSEQSGLWELRRQGYLKSGEKVLVCR